MLSARKAQCFARKINSKFISSKQNAEAEKPEPDTEQILRIPAGKFSCLQITLVAKMDLPGLIRRYFGDIGNKTVILNNILKDTHQFSSRYMEIQIAMD